MKVWQSLLHGKSILFAAQKPKLVIPCLRDKLSLSFLADMSDFSIKTPQPLGSVLKGVRRDKRLTQETVGAKVGLAQKAVSKLELDPGTSGLNQVFKLLAALDLELVVRPRESASTKSEW